MKAIHITMSIIVGVLSLIYDLWLIQNGNLHAATLLVLVGWMALLLTVCARTGASRTKSADESNIASSPQGA